MTHDCWLTDNIEDLQELNSFRYSLLKLNYIIDFGLKGFAEQDRIKTYLCQNGDELAVKSLFDLSLYSLPYIYGHEDGDTTAPKKGGFINFLKRMWTALLNFLKKLFPWFNKKSENLEKHAEAVKNKFNDLTQNATDESDNMYTKFKQHGDDEYQYIDPGDANELDESVADTLAAGNDDNINSNKTRVSNIKSALAAHDYDVDSALKAAPDNITIFDNIPKWIERASEITETILKSSNDIRDLSKHNYDDLKSIKMTRTLRVNTLTSKQISKILDDVLLLANKLTELNKVIEKCINEINEKLNNLNKVDSIDGLAERGDLIASRRGITYLIKSIKQLISGLFYIIDSIHKNIIKYLVVPKNHDKTSD